MEKLDFIEAQAKTLTAFRLETMELLNKRAHTLITLQLGGGGALASLAATLIEKSAPCWVVLGLVTAAVGLLLLAAIGAWLCLFTAPIVPPGNTPKNLYESELEVDDLRAAELSGLQQRQADWGDRNWRLGLALNWLYLATCVVPLVAIVVSAVAR